MPIPGNSFWPCRRWNAPKSLSAYDMSKPAPLSLTKYVLSPDSSANPNSILAGVRFRVNFHAFPSRFWSTARRSAGSPSAMAPAAITHSTGRSRSLSLSSAQISPARELSGTLRDALLQPVARRTELGLLLPDLLEHVVEGHHERSDLVAAAARGTDGVVLLESHLPGGLGEPENRLRNVSLEPGGDGEGDQE